MKTTNLGSMAYWLNWEPRDSQPSESPNKATAQADKTDKSRPARPSVSFVSSTAGESQKNPVCPDVEGTYQPTADSKAAGLPEIPIKAAAQAAQRPPETQLLAPAAQDSPKQRCHACHGYLFWRSLYGSVICVTCHAPSSRSLVSEWLWVEEGSKTRIQ